MDVYMGVLLLFLGCCVLFMLLILIKSKLAGSGNNDTAKQEKEQTITAEKFYLMCREQGFSDLTPANLARMKLLAEQNHLTKTDDEVRAFFIEGKTEVEDRENAERLAEVRKTEQAVVDKHLKYKDFIGREKRIQMYLDEAAIHQEKSSEYYSKYVSLIQHSVNYAHLTAEKEKDWAIAGGVASGIAGGAAGLATAINVQRENEQIRERNAANQASILKMTSSAQERFFKQSCEEKRKAEPFLEKAEETKNKLVEELPQDELFEEISPTLISLETTETGSKKLVVKFTPKKPLFIYEDVRAVVDGSIKASVFNKGTAKKLGETIICLGKDGAVGPVAEETFVMDIEEDDINCDVILEPNHLWAIEK